MLEEDLRRIQVRELYSCNHCGILMENGVWIADHKPTCPILEALAGEVIRLVTEPSWKDGDRN